MGLLWPLYVWSLSDLILLLVGLYVLYRSLKSGEGGGGDLYINEDELTKQRLLMLLEDMRMEYTPYYIHYYHSLTAVHQDYLDRPKLIK